MTTRPAPTPQEVNAAADSLVHNYNDSRSEFLGYRYISQSLLASDRHLREAVAALLAGQLFELEQVRTERDAARVEVDQLRTELAAFTVCPVCCSPPSEPCEHNART